MSEQDLRRNALEYHRRKPYGKIEIVPTKPLATQRDLALAYSPGVAAACEAIVEDPSTVSELTARGNLVAVISNGTAVLGLGDIGPLAAKPVMEGKAVLFKKFAGLDSIDIEIDEKDPDKLIDIIASLEPSFGGINLEDIKAPECFIVEEKLRERMNIPVFHDDQHGTAIIVSAAFYNWVKLSKRKLKSIKLVCNGAGASALACLDLLVDLGLPIENITVCDRKGVVHRGRNEDMYDKKAKYAKDTKKRTLAEALEGADVFLGLSAPNSVKQDDIKDMAKKPLLMTLSNPVPEIMPEKVLEIRPDAIICTGRSDYPNQVNNVLCFPFIFRGALDVGATAINEEMKIACVKAIAELTMAESTAEVAAVYGDTQLKFGPDYLIPKPFDPRLIIEIPSAVAQAAMDSGVATRPIEDMAAYRQQLEQYVYRSGNLMRPVYARAKENPKRICFAEGEESRVLRAAQVVVDEKIGHPILIGRRHVIEQRIEKHNLRLKIDRDFELVDPEDDPRYPEYWTHYWKLMERKGVTKSIAKTIVRTKPTVIGALMVERDEADGLVCGTIGDYQKHKRDVMDVLGVRQGVNTMSAMSGLLIKKGTYFICDPYVNDNPTAEQIAESALLAAAELQKFGMLPRVALLSRSNFGSFDNDNSIKMRAALKLIQEADPGLEVDGEMHADFALDVTLRDGFLNETKLSGEANLLIMPNADAANIAVNIIKTMGDGLVIGPLLLGVKKPTHIMTPMATTRGIINVAALTNVAAQSRELEEAEKKQFRLLRI